MQSPHRVGSGHIYRTVAGSVTENYGSLQTQNPLRLPFIAWGTQKTQSRTESGRFAARSNKCTPRALESDEHASTQASVCPSPDVASARTLIAFCE